MVRVNGMIMTDVKYAELQKAQKAKVGIMGRLNHYFFGSERISASDAVWFYGSLSAISAVTALSVVVTLIG